MKLVLLVAITQMIISCSKATSKPEYKYKKAGGNGVVAQIGDIKITEKELFDGIESELYDAEMKLFDIKFNKLNSLILEKLMKADPKKKGLTNDQYMEKYIASKVQVTDKEIQDFIVERKVPKNQVNDQIKERIKNYLSVDKKRVAVQAWIAERTKKTGIDVYFEKPKRPTFDVKVGDSPFAGGKNAKVEVVEFSDFQCPFCAKGAEVVTQLKKKYGNKIKVVFKQYPLPFHSQAKGAAIAALCANEQSSDFFWKLHDKMFADQSKLSIDSIKATAKELGVKTDAFNKCLDSKKYMAQVEKDIQQGKGLGVKSTPTFFVNGQLIAGAQPLEVFSEVIDQELEK